MPNRRRDSKLVEVVPTIHISEVNLLRKRAKLLVLIERVQLRVQVLENSLVNMRGLPQESNV